MKNLIIVILIAVVAILGYRAWEQRNKKLDVQVKVVEVRAAAKPTPQPTRPTPEKMVCPFCNGEKFYMAESRRRRCPVCGARGYRRLTVPSGYRVCPDCKGMGKVAEKDRVLRSRKLYNADRCPRCRGKGYVSAVE